MSRVSVNSALNSYKKHETKEDGSGSTTPKKQKLTVTATTSTSDSTPPPPPPPPPPLNNTRKVVSSWGEEDSDEEKNPLSGTIENSESEENPQPLNQIQTNNLPLTVTITDVDVFKCPLCFKKFTIPVHQCVEGHIVCDSCIRKIDEICPTCSSPIEQRCWGMEKVLMAVQISCRNLIYGCQHKMKFGDEREHEDNCVYTPCSCPVYDCNFVHSATNLYQHFGKKHNGINFRFNYRFIVPIERDTAFIFLRENTSGTLFVLRQFSVHHTSALNVVLIAPKSDTGKYRYELEAKDGEESLSLESAVASVTELVVDRRRPTNYLLVLEDFPSPLGQVMLQIRIRRAG